MSVSLTSFAFRGVIGLASAFVPLRWSLSAFGLFLAAATLSGIGAAGGDAPAPLFWLSILIMASPLVVPGCVVGGLPRKLLRSGGTDAPRHGGRPS